MEAPCPLITPTVEFSVALIEKTRQRMLKIVEEVSPEQLLRIPHGFHNNLLWNLGHATATLQILCYEKSGLPPSVPVYLIAPFRKGTSPAQWTGTMDVEEIKVWLMESVKTLHEDLRKTAFTHYTPYETSAGVLLTCISDALSFVAWHEAQHLGIMLAMQKLV